MQTFSLEWQELTDVGREQTCYNLQETLHLHNWLQEIITGAIVKFNSDDGLLIQLPLMDALTYSTCKMILKVFLRKRDFFTLNWEQNLHSNPNSINCHREPS